MGDKGRCPNLAGQILEAALYEFAESGRRTQSNVLLLQGQENDLFFTKQYKAGIN